jgi:transposase
MYKRFHGFDLHKHYVTIIVRDEEGRELQYISRCADVKEYVENLNKEDAVVIEAVNNAFYWADRIEKQGAKCIIVNTHRFKIIKESWNKTDKRDAGNLSLALWMSETRKEFKLPAVYKPSKTIRELRRLFSQYQMLNEQICQHKNTIQAIFVENGIALKTMQKKELFNSKNGMQMLDDFEISDASRSCIEISLEILWDLKEQKDKLRGLIYLTGRPLEKEILILITIKGVTAFLALAFLSDVGDISRFSSVRQFNSYMGVVPTVSSSGGKTIMGHINKHSRKLARTLFTQVVIHIISSSESMQHLHDRIKMRRGACRSRIAVIRKTFGIMRSMLLGGKEYYWKDEKNVQAKIYEYKRILKKAS